MPDKPTDGGSFDASRYKNPETALGGADAVAKTTYVTGSGTEPEAHKPVGVGVSAKVGAGGGQSATWAIVVFLIVAAALVYLLGYGR